MTFDSSSWVAFPCDTAALGDDDVLEAYDTEEPAVTEPLRFASESATISSDNRNMIEEHPTKNTYQKFKLVIFN